MKARPVGGAKQPRLKAAQAPESVNKGMLRLPKGTGRLKIPSSEFWLGPAAGGTRA